MKMHIQGHTRNVSRYYDRNTWLFNMFGHTGGSRNIHASLWGPGVTTIREASNYTNDLICRNVRQVSNSPVRVLDLGCGVGASLAYLANHLEQPAELKGITLSHRQAELGNKLANRSGNSYQIIAGDYHGLPISWSGLFDVTFALEAFVHSSHPERFFEEASRILTQGGALVLIDTFPTLPLVEQPEPVRQLLSDYLDFWKAGHILTVSEVQAIASAFGLHLTEDADLTDLVEKDRPRDRWIALFNRRFHRLTTLHPYLHALRGGHAVQCGLQQGWLRYRMLTFTKVLA